MQIASHLAFPPAVDDIGHCCNPARLGSLSMQFLAYLVWPAEQETAGSLQSLKDSNKSSQSPNGETDEEDFRY